MNRFRWRTAAKIAWRESRASAVKFGFVILAVAVGVGSLTGVRGFSTAFRTMLSREARTLMAADVTARVFVMPTADQQKVLDELSTLGVRQTWTTETLTMAASTKSPVPVLVSAKAVDPTLYPFYGEIKFEPAGRIQDVLREDTVALSSDLSLRLSARVGDFVKLGGQDYRVAGIVVNEPDRMTGTINIGPRLMMSRDALERTGLLNAGSRAAQKFLFQLGAPGTPDVATLRERLKQTFPDAQVIDYRESHPIVTRGLDRSTMFLSLVSLIALIVGALGVAMAMYSHLQQKLDSIAVMKCLGARSGQIIRIYVVQTLALGLLGGLLGVAVGAGVQMAFPKLIARYFHIDPGFVWDWTSIVQGLAAGVLSTLLFTLPPLLSIRRIRPSLILRREMADARRGWGEKLRNSRESILVTLGILAGMGALAGWLAGGKWQDAARLGGYFTGGVAVSLLALSGVAWLLLRTLRGVLRIPGLRLPSHLRHGMANLYRPGNQAQAVLVAFGLGVMFTATIYLVQKSMLEEIAASAPPGMPNVFLIDIQASQKDGVEKLMAQQKGLDKPAEFIPSVAARLVSVNGKEVSQMDLKGFERRFLQTRSVTWRTTIPMGTKIKEGAWWTTTKPGLVSISAAASRVLKATPGTKMKFVASGREIEAAVVAVHEVEQVQPGAATEFVFTPESLADLPAIYFAGARVRPADVPAIQTNLYAAYPTVSVINVADVIQTIQEVVDQIALIVRFISAFAILAGVVILASSVAGTRFRRIREVVILKTLGGTKKKVGRIFSAEFLILGATAGLMGSMLAVVFSNVMLIRFFEGEWRFEIVPVSVAVVLSAIVANGAGWMASARILSQKPLEVLRSE